MDFKKLKYHKRDWKYELDEEEEVFTIPKRRHYLREDDGRWISDKIVCGGYATISAGKVKVRKGYCWDGPSSPIFDTEDAMRASLFHDVLYQCIKEGDLSDINRRKADIVLRKVLISDGMLKWRRILWYYMVRVFGGFWLTKKAEEASPQPLEDMNNRTASP